MNNIFSKLKKCLPKVLTGILIILFSINVAHASTPLDGFFLAGGIKLLVQIVSDLALLINTLAGWFLSMCATLLNVSMQLTVHLGNFIQATPVIYTVWSTIRDLASMVLIFFILWAAIQMILDVKQPNFGGLLKSIVIAGILINFSFFFTQVLIDASNIVSLQFFNAIAPAQKSTYSPNDTVSQIISKSIQDGSGGFSGVFANSLRVTQWWSNKGELQSPDPSIAIILANYTGAVVQFIAGISFLAAAIAALWRTVVLVFLLGFSSVWIASYAVPQLNKAKEKWMGMFQANLTFLPIYLAFMYVSILFITHSDLANLATNISQVGTSSAQYLVLFITFAVVLIFVNLPLFAAISISGATVGVIERMGKWSTDFTRKVTYRPVINAAENIGNSTVSAASGAANIVTTRIPGAAMRFTVGKTAAAADKALGKTKFGNSLLGRDLRASTVGALAANKFGTKRSYLDYKKDSKVVKTGAAEIERSKDLKIALENLKTGTPPVPGKTIKDIVGKMKESEKLNMGSAALKNTEVLKHLKKSDFEAIKKADESDINDADKEIIKNNRIDALMDAIANNESNIVGNMMKSYDTEDLVKILNDKYSGATVVSDVVVDNITRGMLENIGKEKIDDTVKKKIGRTIRFWTATHPKSHPAEGLVKKNALEWTGIP